MLFVSKSQFRIESTRKHTLRKQKICKIQWILFKLRHNFPLSAGFYEFQTEDFGSEEQAVLFLMITPSSISLMGHVSALQASGSGKFLLSPRGCSAIFSSEIFSPCLLGSGGVIKE